MLQTPKPLSRWCELASRGWSTSSSITTGRFSSSQIEETRGENTASCALLQTGPGNHGRSVILLCRSYAYSGCFQLFLHLRNHVLLDVAWPVALLNAFRFKHKWSWGVWKYLHSVRLFDR